uniref:Uncharacterized protein n=1 Tax=Rhizophora mucronata TaxID=61149 RepID=A0A2P2QIX8_RHIMU
MKEDKTSGWLQRERMETIGMIIVELRPSRKDVPHSDTRYCKTKHNNILEQVTNVHKTH